MSGLTKKPMAILWAVICVGYLIDLVYDFWHHRDYISIILTGICAIVSAELVRSELSDKRSALKRR